MLGSERRLRHRRLSRPAGSVVCLALPATFSMEGKMHRQQILENAIEHTCGDRDVEYGSPKNNLHNIALLWNAYLEGKYSRQAFELTSEDVAWLNVLQKMARTFSFKAKPDTYEDAAAYAAIAGECAE